MHSSFTSIKVTILFLFCYQISFSQVVADFSADRLEGCAPQLIQFTDNSQGNIVSYNWTLGTPDGTCNTGPGGTQANPGRIFTDPGTYCICLTVTDDLGNSDTECKSDYITIFAPPVADFAADELVGCAPLTINFNDLSIPGSGTITGWQWDLNSSSCATTSGQNVSCTYTNPGVYDITLIVTDENGCIHFITKDDYIEVLETPEASFTADVTGSCVAPLTVSFSNTVSNPGNYNFEWLFGTGDSSTDPNPTYTYNSLGDYSVTQIIVDPISGCSDTLEIVNFITLGNAVNFSYTPENGCEDLTVDFTDLTAGTASNWSWDFGDGVGTSNVQNPSYTYTTPGCYTVTLTADSDGCTATRTAPFCIEVFPEISGSYSSTDLSSCTLPHTVSFTSSAPIGTTYNWDFGDGNGTSTLANPSYTFTDYGTFPVSMTITSTDGCEFTIVSDTVKLQEFNIGINPDVVNGCIPLDINFSGSSNSTTPIVNWDWDFGNGANGMGQNGMTTYADTGSYTIILIAENQDGCIDTTSTLIEAGMQLPVDFDADPKINCAEDQINFSDLSDGDIDQWFWEFGDGGTSSQANPIYTYSDTGYFDVCLTIFNNGCENQLCRDSFIYILPPIASFEIDQTCENPYTVNFTDESTGADQWSWNFDTNTNLGWTSTDQHPSFTYPDRGTYLVELEVYNILSDCYNTTNMTVIITDPIANFTFEPDTGCAPLVIQLTDLSVDADNYNWSAPGGSFTPNNGAAEPTLTYDTQGIYTDLQLIVEDIHGCFDTLLLPDEILVSDVSPNFTISTPAGCLPLTVDFTESSTSFGGNIVSYLWDFGDGNNSSDQNPTHQYNTRGTFDISLTVTNELGCSQTHTIPNGVEVTFPVPNFTVQPLACTDQTISFNNTSNSSGPNTWLWDFGDGFTSTQNNPSHSYALEGTYDVCLTATDHNGCTDQICKTQIVTVANPLANFVADTTFATCPPLLVNFSDLSSNAVGWEWDFGDNSALVTGQNPQHIYTEPGIYDVCLIITSPSDCRDTLCFEDYIQIDGPIGSFDLVEPLTGCVPLEVEFFGSGQDIVKYTWDNGNGDIQIHETTSTQDSATFTYNAPGTYFPILIVEDAQGCQRSFPYPDPVVVEDLNIDFVPIDSTHCGSGTLEFTALINTTLAPVNLEWQFPGGSPSTSSIPNPIVTYTNPGSYDVILIADNGMCMDTMERLEVVTIADIPVADFTFAPPEGCNPLPVTFTDLSTVGFGSSIVNWTWDFGTGDSAFVANPNYVYDTPGTYNITLVVESESGCTHSTSQQITIYETPVADAGKDPTICMRDITQLNASGGVNYTWTPATDLSCSDCPNPIASPLDTTTYVVLVESAEGCTDTDTVRVNVLPFPLPDITVSVDTLVCEGDFVQIFVSTTTPNVNFYWDSSIPGLSCYDNCFNPIATPSETTTYYVSAIGEGGCTVTDSIRVVVIDDEADIAGPDRTICEGDQVQLSTNLGTNAFWSPSIGLSCAYCSDPIVYPSSTQTYYVSVTTGNNCTISDSITVFVVNQDAIDAGEDQTICLGENITLMGTGGGQVSWSPASSLDDATILTPIAAPTESTTYSLTLTNDLCVLEDEVTIEVRNKAEITAIGDEICLGDTATVSANGFATDFTWIPSATLGDLNQAETTAFPNSTTTYAVIGNIGLCTPDTAYAEVIVHLPPVLNIQPAFGFLEGQEVDIDIDVSGSGGYTYNWYPAEYLDCTDCPSPTAMPDSSTTLFVQVWDENGCYAEGNTELRMKSECSGDLVVVPNAFTPNADGLNDVLYVRGSTISEINIFRIYDRWGALIFETNDMNQGWDGTYKGKPVNPGVFVYYVETPCFKDGSTILKKGNVTVIK